MLLRPPQDGLEGVDPLGALICRMPAYGTRDSGRGLWKRLRSEVTAHGLRESKIMSVLFYLRGDSGRLVGWKGTHVDDLMWAVESEHENLINDI